MAHEAALLVCVRQRCTAYPWQVHLLHAGFAGFHHSDLRLANVMEILPQSGPHTNGELHATEITQSEHNLREERQKEVAEPGSATDRFKYQFKIIDYGLANFEETYACGPDLFPNEVCCCRGCYLCIAALCWAALSMCNICNHRSGQLFWLSEACRHPARHPCTVK